MKYFFWLLKNVKIIFTSWTIQKKKKTHKTVGQIEPACHMYIKKEFQKIQTLPLKAFSSSKNIWDRRIKI